MLIELVGTVEKQYWLPITHMLFTSAHSVTYIFLQYKIFSSALQHRTHFNDEINYPFLLTNYLIIN